MLKNYFKIAWRNLWRNRIYTGINILGLALGITCCIVIYVFMRYELTFDAFHSQSDHTYRIVEHHQTANGTQYWNTTAYPLAEALRSEFPELNVTQAVGPVSEIIGTTGDNGQQTRFEEDRLLYVDPHYLHLFDFKEAGGLWIAGDPQSAFINPNSIVLTRQSVNRYFPSAGSHFESVLGKTLLLGDKDLLTVTGVVENPPPNTNLLFEVLIPYHLFKNNNPYQAGDWSGNHQGTTFVGFSESGNIADWENRINSFKTNYIRAEDQQRITYFLQPLKDIHTETLYGNSIGSYVMGTNTLVALGALGVFLIAIACFNYINLATALSTNRAKEVGVRKMAGSSRMQLVVQFLIEMLALVLIAILLSVAGAEWILNYLNQSISVISPDLTFDYTIVFLALVLLVVILLGAGGYPALSLSKKKPITAFQATTSSGSAKRLSVRQGTIILQFAIAYVLIVCTLVITRQMQYAQSTDLGFTRDAIITISIPEQQPGKLEIFRERLLQSPAIKNISYASGTPTTTLRQYGTNFRLNQEPASRMQAAEMKVVDLNYLELYDLNIIAGSWLSEANKVRGFNGFIVNEALVKALDLKPDKAVGELITINEGEAPIVGVVEDFHNNSLQETISPCLMFYWGGAGFFDTASIQFQSGRAGLLNFNETLQYVEDTWHEIFPEGIYHYEFLDDYLDRNYLVENFLLYVFNIFSAISIFIACLGLFGLTAFTTQRRIKEIGIRKVLGASVADIVGLLSKDLLKLVLVGFILAVPIAWYAMNQWLSNFAYRIEIGPGIFVIAGGVALLVALATVSWQSVRAALMNPVNSLRSE